MVRNDTNHYSQKKKKIYVDYKYYNEVLSENSISLSKLDMIDTVPHFFSDTLCF